MLNKVRLLFYSFLVLNLFGCSQLEELGTAVQKGDFEIISEQIDYQQRIIDYYTQAGLSCSLETMSCMDVFSIPQDNPGDLSILTTTFDLLEMNYTYSSVIIAGYAHLSTISEANLKTGIFSYQSYYVDTYNGLTNAGVAAKNVITGKFIHEIDVTPPLTTTHTKSSLESIISTLEITMNAMTQEVYGLALKDFIISDFNQ
jgi:hypothetical protein